MTAAPPPAAGPVKRHTSRASRTRSPGFVLVMTGNVVREANCRLREPQIARRLLYSSSGRSGPLTQHMLVWNRSVRSLPETSPKELRYSCVRRTSVARARSCFGPS